MKFCGGKGVRVHRFSKGLTLRNESSPKPVRSLLCLATSTILDARCDVCNRNRGSGRHWNGGTPRHSSFAWSTSQLTFFFCFPAAALSAGSVADAVEVFVATVFFFCCVLLLGLGGVVCPEKQPPVLPPPELMPNHASPLLPGARCVWLKPTYKKWVFWVLSVHWGNEVGN